jgi:hypothetical protein
MQRVRIGITGLAVVFLIVLLAAAVVGFRSKDRGGEANQIAEGGNSTKSPPTDPLAELGVAPGGTSSESGATQGNNPRR